MKIFFFWKAIKIVGSAQKTGSVEVAETQFSRPKTSLKTQCNDLKRH